MTSKQRAYLRSMANTMETILYVGKDGIVPGTIKQASDALEAREIIKCAIQQNCPLTAKEALNGIDPVDVVKSYRFEQGFTFELNLGGVADDLRDDFVATGPSSAK